MKSGCTQFEAVWDARAVRAAIWGSLPADLRSCCSSALGKGWDTSGNEMQFEQTACFSHRRKSEHIQLLSPQDTSRPSKQAVTLLGRQDPIQSHLGSEAVRGQEQGILTHRLVTAVINFYDCKGGEKGGRNRLIIIRF